MLTTAQITTLSGLLAACRDDWDKAGAHAFVAKLAADPRPWPLLVRQAVENAADARNLTPKCILTPLPSTIPQGGAGLAVSAPMRPEKREPCGLCGSTQTRNDGSCLGCWQNANTAHVNSGVRCGTGSKPSPEAQRLLAEFRAGYIERARTQK